MFRGYPAYKGFMEGSFIPSGAQTHNMRTFSSDIIIAACPPAGPCLSARSEVPRRRDKYMFMSLKASLLLL